MSTHSTLRRRHHDPVRSASADDRLPELLLYPGNLCNRACHFCCVEGSPEGDFQPFDERTPARVMRLILPDARIKLYGGEPTLHHRRFIDLVTELRHRGYRGRLTVFSNGIQADRLIEMLEADPPTAEHAGSDAYLNHYIWHGETVDPIPESRRIRLQDWGSANPDRLWLGHDDVLPVGGADPPERDGPDLGPAPPFGGRCARCYPTLRSDGTLHACAFAVEVESPRYDLGPVAQSPAKLRAERERFLRWIDEEVEPAAAALGESPCTTCLRWARYPASDRQGRTSAGTRDLGTALPVV